MEIGCLCHMRPPFLIPRIIRDPVPLTGYRKLISEFFIPEYVPIPRKFDRQPG